jgi:hypothetical protein
MRCGVCCALLSCAYGLGLGFRVRVRVRVATLHVVVHCCAGADLPSSRSEGLVESLRLWRYMSIQKQYMLRMDDAYAALCMHFTLPSAAECEALLTAGLRAASDLHAVRRTLQQIKVGTECLLLTAALCVHATRCAAFKMPCGQFVGSAVFLDNIERPCHMHHAPCQARRKVTVFHTFPHVLLRVSTCAWLQVRGWGGDDLSVLCLCLGPQHR